MQITTKQLNINNLMPPFHINAWHNFFTTQWLQTEALQNNPKIEVSSDKTRFAFKPVFKLKDGKSLVKLLKQYDLKGLGGILLEDIQESLPHGEKVLKARANEIIYITRPTDKKKILFYNDKTATIAVRYELLCLIHSQFDRILD